MDSINKSLLLGRGTRQGKKCEYVAEKGWRLVPSFAQFPTMQRVYDEIRTEFRENDSEKECKST